MNREDGQMKNISLRDRSSLEMCKHEKIIEQPIMSDKI